jgi:hypothetical protein
MEFALSIAGRKLAFRMPTIDELSTQRKSARVEAKRLKGLKKLVRDCCLDVGALDDLLAERAGVYVSIGDAILTASGATGPLEVLEEAEVSVEQGEALVAFASHGQLVALRYVAKIGTPMDLVVRAFGDRELDEYTRGSDSVATCKQLCKRVVKLGDVDEIEKRCPGLFIALCEYLTEHTGALMEIELGEA